MPKKKRQRRQKQMKLNKLLSAAAAIAAALSSLAAFPAGAEGLQGPDDVLSDGAFIYDLVDGCYTIKRCTASIVTDLRIGMSGTV